MRLMTGIYIMRSRFQTNLDATMCGVNGLHVRRRAMRLFEWRHGLHSLEERSAHGVLSCDSGSSA
jgi:hypothetical protein